MSHDIDDLLDMIVDLEARIILLELQVFKQSMVKVNEEDSWYWNH